MRHRSPQPPGLLLVAIAAFVMAALLVFVVAGQVPTGNVSPDPYWRYVSIERVVDGDTLALRVEHTWGGLTYWTKDTRARILGIDAPELHDEGGMEARGEAEAWVKRCVDVTDDDEPAFVAWSKDKDEYDRALVSIMCRETGGDFALWMLTTANAEEYRK